MKMTLRFGTPKNVTQSGQDGVRYEFPFSVVCKQQATTRHRLQVCVAARISWGHDENYLVNVLFRVGLKEVWDTLQSLGYLSELIVAYIPHGNCPYEPEKLGSPDGAIIEIEMPG